MAADRRLCRPHPQGCEACGPAGRTIEQVRAGDQPPDRPNAGHHRAADAAVGRRRGDRMIRRREFITLIGGAAASWPLAARAQQPGKVYRIGFLANDPTILTTPASAAFRDGLRQNGLVDGDNILIDWRFAEGKTDRYAELAATLVSLRMDLIVASGSSSAIAAKEATKTI